MDNILPTEETTEFEDRIYLNPQTGIDETNTFISNLRDTQNANNAQILEQTRNLGTNVPSNLGGLTGGEGYFTSRYQTPQTNTNVANLRATTQASAMKQVLANEEAMWKKRYQDAYRAYQKSAYDKSNLTNPGSDGNTTQNETTVELGSVSTEALAESRYNQLLMKYLQAGYPTDIAEKMAKEDFSKSIDVGESVEPYQYNRQKSSIGGDSAYIYTLPNGGTVLVDENKYELINTGNGYVLKDKTTGKLTQVGE